MSVLYVDPTAAFATINLAYISLLIGAFCKSLNRVRVLLVLAALFFVAYGTLQGIQSMVVWNLVIGGLNFYWLVAGLWREGRTRLTAEQETLRRRLFAGLAPADFQRLWVLGEDLLCVDEPVVEAGAAPDRLHLVVRGGVHIERDGAVLGVLGPGAVIGELESAPFSRPAADWVAVGAVWLRSWLVADLSEPGLPRQALRSLGRPGVLAAGVAA